jgi:radical SAM protein with 4Fe4S-binding SPASM domain
MSLTSEILSTGNPVWPRLFAFAVLRPEPFGALVFNPYLAAEVELNPMEAGVASLCDGKTSAAAIKDRIRESYGITPKESEECVVRVLDRLAQLCVLTLGRRESGGSSRPIAPAFPLVLPQISVPKSVTWDVTYACNLKCPHCLTSSGRRRKNELGTLEAFRLIDRLAEAKVLYLSLSGGEPFLRPDILHLLGRIAATNMRVDVATNGTVMNEELLAGLKDLPVFQTQISIDGVGESHDLFRGRPGAFAAACRTAEKLRAVGIATSLSTTVTRQNLDQIESIIALAIDLGCSGYKAIPFMPAGRGKENAAALALNPQAHYRFCRMLVEARSKYLGRINVSTETSFAFLLEEVPVGNPECGLMACSAGHDTLSVGPDGTAYPCPFLHSFPLGNLLEDSLANIWCDSSMLRKLRSIDKHELKGACRTCEYAPSRCRGGCRAAAYLHAGDILGTDPNCFREVAASRPKE